MTLVLSFAAMGFEVAIVKTLSTLINNSILAQAITIGVFILSLAFGTFLHRYFNKKDQIKTLFHLEILIAILGSCALFIFIAWVSVYNIFLSRLLPNVDSAMVYILSAQIPTIIIGSLVGIELPLLILLAERFKDGRAEAFVLSANYLGSLLACLVLPLYLFKYFDTVSVAILVSELNCTIALWAYARSDWKWKNPRSTIILIPLGIVYALLYFEPRLNEYYLKSLYMDYIPSNLSADSIKNVIKMVQNKKPIERILSRYQYIDIVYPGLYKDQDFNSNQPYLFYLDHKLQWSSKDEHVYHQSMVHGTVDLLGYTPKNVLVLGGGDGLLVRELLLYENIDSIELVEIDQVVVDLAQKNPQLTNLNKYALHSPKVKIIIDDAFKQLLREKKKYDIIFIDFPFPNSYEINRLFSVEFYRRIKNALNSEGIAVLDFPLDTLNCLMSENYKMKHPNHVDIIYSTLSEAGFENSLAFGFYDPFVAVRVKKEPKLKFNFKKLQDNKLISNSAFVNLRPIGEDCNSPIIKLEYVNSVFRPISLETKEQ